MLVLYGPSSACQFFFLRCFFKILIIFYNSSTAFNNQEYERETVLVVVSDQNWFIVMVCKYHIFIYLFEITV